MLSLEPNGRSLPKTVGSCPAAGTPVFAGVQSTVRYSGVPAHELKLLTVHLVEASGEQGHVRACAARCRTLHYGVVVPPSPTLRLHKHESAQALAHNVRDRRLSAEHAVSPLTSRKAQVERRGSTYIRMALVNEFSMCVLRRAFERMEFCVTRFAHQSSTQCTWYPAILSVRSTWLALLYEDASLLRWQTPSISLWDPCV